MSDDTLQSATVDDLELRVGLFRQQPEGGKFTALRNELRTAGRGELLAELCATWAPLERDPVRAADAWSEAGEAMVVLGETATAIEYLRVALDLDPMNDRAADRLLEIVEPGDPAAAVEIIEHELAELAKPNSKANAQRRAEITARRAAQHRRAAELWNDHLGRVDRALWHYQQAFKLEPQRTEALAAARSLYASLGEDAMVAKLYQAELDVVSADRTDKSPATNHRKAALRRELGRLAKRGKDLELAANHLEEASRLDPTSLEIAEELADIYSTPGFRDDKTRHKAGELFVELGRRRLREADDASGINYLRRAVGVDPFSKGNSAALEQALDARNEWSELDRQLRHRTNMVEGTERADVLRRRAALYRNQIPDRAGLVEVLSELVAYEQPGTSKSSRELRELLRDDQDWPQLSRLIEAEVNALGQDPNTPGDTIVAELLELATIAREHMNDRDRAAELLHQALGVMPDHEEALARYVDHFRERRDWRGLIDLYEFALDGARDLGTPHEEIVRRLEEIGQIAELRLGDIPRAIEAWQRIGEMEPGSTKVAEALRRLTSRGKMWEQLVATLEHEVAVAPSAGQRANAVKKMAQTYRERQIEPRRAIELYEEVLQQNPDDDHTLKALMELYEREGDDAGLASSLRRLLELEERRMLEAGAPVVAGQPAEKSWPVSKRTERLTQMRRLAVLYETRLADVDGVVFASSGVLELLPGDRDALERMERVLEKAGDPRLEQTLEYHAAASSSPAERAKLMKRLAKLAAAREDEITALERWEQTLRASPSDADALAALVDLYERAERWTELVQVMDRRDGGKPLPPPGTPEAAIRALELERYATVIDQHLGDAARAPKAWHRVLELSPKNRTALESLARLYRAGGKWRELADILGAQVPLLQADDLDQACEAAMERAEILEQKLGAPLDAIKVLDAVIRDLNPNNLEAHTALRRLHEARGDFDAAVRIAEREMYLSSEPIRKIARGLEIGMICRDRLNNPTRALQAFKRVLELDPNQDEALSGAADLLARLGRWKEYVATLERMLAALPTPESDEAYDGLAEERRTLVQRIAAATADKLGDPKGAFRWWRRAHEEAPDEQTLGDVRRAGEAYGLWRELGDVLTDERKRLVAGGGGIPTEPARFVALSRELAGLCERRLGDKPRAVIMLAEALGVAPRDASLLAEIERLATEQDQRTQWKVLIDAFETALASASPAERVELYLRRARILDERVNDAKAAVADALAAFSWAPDREDIRELLVKLAAKARAWTDVIAVDGALIERAATGARRVELLRRKANVIEEQLKDAPRAFRTHLVAMLLAPDDADTTSHLWRLARVIGKYREVDRTPHAEPPTATVQGEQAVGEAVAAATRAQPGRPNDRLSASHLRREEPDAVRPRANRLATEPIDMVDLEVANLSVGDSTQPLDLTEVELAIARGTGPSSTGARPPVRPPIVAAGTSAPPRDEFTNEQATMALNQSDLRGMMVPPRLPPGAKAPPRPPPRPPQIRRPSQSQPPPFGAAGVGSGPVGVPRKAQAIVRRPPLPTLPNRSFESPWEELAVAFESLPATDIGARLRWLYRASEVWETGGKDIARAFDALARAFAIARRETKTDAAQDGEARARLHRIASDHKAWDRLANLYEGMAEDAETAVAAADLLMEVSRIRGEQKRPREAEAQLRRILGMLPNEPTARQRLEELYRAEGRWVELAASLEERTDPRLGTAAPEAERPQLLRELAAIYTEKLQRPHDAIDAMERLRLLAPTDTGVLRELAQLFSQLGRWSKVIETLQRLVETASDAPAEGGSADDEVKAALRWIAKIYLDELELPDRAADAYREIVNGWPDDTEAFSALDQLYTASAKWADLAEVLRRRAGLARDPAERAQLLGRRAQVLIDRLDLAEEAAAALRMARTIAPDDTQVADQLVAALIKAGREREAAAILEDRIDSHTHGKGPAGELAALHIRLAQLMREKLDDQAGARAAIEAALVLVPEHPTAHAMLSELASGSDDPRTFADAKLREAEHAADDDTRIAAWMTAGELFQQKVGDIAAAQETFERVLALRPYHAEATWALAGLVEKGGDPETAARLLERRLETAEQGDTAMTPPEKARLLTQLAALSRLAGVEPAAERRLLEALGCVPDHIPAIIALADFYADAARWSDLEAFLRDVLDGTVLAAAPAALIADLHRRMARAHEMLGRDDDAYQTLVAADRLHRGHLLIKLALGENRYKARRWREATLHLSPLATHEDAARYPSEVAQGLYHAALAEIRSLRPEKAAPLYARALELKPTYAPALQALAEIAMEQGDPKKAADLLTRQATATEEPAERMRLFEALGDMALAMLSDEARATSCYTSAVAAAQPLEARHVPLLEKLLERQAAAGDRNGSARSAELLAAFGATPAERAAQYLRAARDYAAAGDRARARSVADRAVEADAYDVDAVDFASGLALDGGDVDAAAAMLTRLLSAKDDRASGSGADQTARRAELSFRLGHARNQRGDQRQAVPAFERAIAIAPESAGATSARRELIEIARSGSVAESRGVSIDRASDDGSRKVAVAGHLQAITAATGELADLVAWADELRRSDRAADVDPARAALELAAAAGHALDVHAQAFLASHKAHVMRDDEPYKAVLDPADRDVLKGGTALAPIAEILSDAAALLWPDMEEALARAGVGGAKRVPATLNVPATAMFPRLTTTLGTGAVMLYQIDAGPDVTVVAAATPVVVLGPRLVADATPATIVRALLARAVELCRAPHLVFAGMPAASAGKLVASIARLYGTPLLREAAANLFESATEDDEAVQRAHDDLVKSALSVKIRSRLETALAALAPQALDVGAAQLAAAQVADRAALLLGGDPSALLTAIRARGFKDGSLKHVIGAVAQPAWLALRAKLGVGVR